MTARTLWLGTILSACVVLCVAGCGSETDSVTGDPEVPTIYPPTKIMRTPMMVDRPLPDDCEQIVPVAVLNKQLGRELPGERQRIVGIPEPATGRTSKIDCYHGVPERGGLTDAQLIISLSTYVDPKTATMRVDESVTAEKSHGATTSTVDVGRQKGLLVKSKDQRMVIGSLGKTTFVVRGKNGIVPDDQVGTVFAALAAQSMTPIEDET